MSSAKVVVRLKPKINEADKAVQVVQSTAVPALLIKKSESEDGLYQFSFTSILSEASQADTYETCGREIVESVLNGYNGTIMAYGQTGAGKTYTMTGRDGALATGSDRGIVLRTVQQIFEGLKSGAFLHSRVQLSYIEIYNESFRDLLRPETASSDLAISDNKGIISVKNLSCEECRTVAEAERVLTRGLSNRHIAAHNLNSDSSRSHAIISVWLDMVDKDGRSMSAKLNLVDLAGSERFSKTGTQGAVAKEALHINKSLAFLEQTVIALGRKQQYVPFRSSKLTHLLKDSIGGNCRTLLIACVWSDAEQLSETISTCRFAQRMMKVSENPHRNTGGLSSVHGNLFKLDPVMQQYLESMTAAAVAKEKAQLYAEFARSRGESAAELGPGEIQELAALRQRVRELELHSQSREVSERQAVDTGTLAVMNGLRERVQQLERDIATANTLQSSHARLASQDGNEERECPVASRLERDDAPSSSGSPDEEPAQDEEAKAGPSSSLAEFLAEAGPSKLSSLYTRIISRTWQGDAEDDDFRDCQDRLSDAPQLSEAAGSASSSEGVPAHAAFLPKHFGAALAAEEQAHSCDKLMARDDGHLVVSSPGSALSTPQGVTPSAWAAASRPKPQDLLGGSKDSPLQEAAAHKQSQRSPDMPLRTGQSSHRSEFAIPAAAPFRSSWDKENGGICSPRLAGDGKQKRKGLFARLFSKKGEQHEEHDSFSHFGPVEEAEEENTAPNIVILNSLNHNQLLELLKARPLSQLRTPVKEPEGWTPHTPESGIKEVAARASGSACSTATGIVEAEPLPASPDPSLTPTA